MTLRSIPYSRGAYSAYILKSTDMKPLRDVEDWALLIEEDTGLHWRFVEAIKQWIPDPTTPSVASGNQSVTLRPLQGDVVLGEGSNLVSGTPVRIIPGQTILGFFVRFSDRGSAVAKELRIVFDAANDADADGKLLNPGSRRLVDINGEANFVFSTAVPVQRIDMASDVATETGASKLYYELVLMES